MLSCDKLLDDSEALHAVAAYADTFQFKVQAIKEGQVFTMLRMTKAGKPTEKTCVFAFDEFQDILVDLSEVAGLSPAEQRIFHDHAFQSVSVMRQSDLDDTTELISTLNALVLRLKGVFMRSEKVIGKLRQAPSQQKSASYLRRI